MMVGLTSGHTKVITHKPEGTDVPPMFRKEAIARGCVPVGVGADAEAPQETEKTKQEQIIAAIEQMLDGGNEEDFTADGKPDVRALSRMAGFQIAREERDAAWEEVSKTLQAGE